MKFTWTPPCACITDQKWEYGWWSARIPEPTATKIGKEVVYAWQRADGTWWSLFIAHAGFGVGDAGDIGDTRDAAANNLIRARALKVKREERK